MKRQVKYLGNKAIILPTAFVEFLEVFSRLMGWITVALMIVWVGYILYGYLLLILKWR